MAGALIFVLGLVFGSFANVCIYRLPKGRSLVNPGSHCPGCGHAIVWYDNIPVLSWFLLRARCRFCHEKISARYPVVELLTGILFLGLYLKFQNSPILLPAFVHLGIFLLSLVIISFIDIDTYLIPDVIVLPGIILGLVGAFFIPEYFFSLSRVEGLLYSLAGMFLGGFLLWLIAILGRIAYKKDAMGGGDVKLLAMIGAYLGWKSVFITIFFAALLGSIISLTLIGLKIKKMDDYIPFGPYLALGAVIGLIWKGYTFYGFFIP